VTVWRGEERWGAYELPRFWFSRYRSRHLAAGRVRGQASGQRPSDVRRDLEMSSSCTLRPRLKVEKKCAKGMVFRMGGRVCKAVT
jgi:hypothetical protein